MEAGYLIIKFLQAFAANTAALVWRLRKQFCRKLLLHTPTLILFSSASFA